MLSCLSPTLYIPIHAFTTIDEFSLPQISSCCNLGVIIHDTLHLFSAHVLSTSRKSYKQSIIGLGIIMMIILSGGHAAFFLETLIFSPEPFPLTSVPFSSMLRPSGHPELSTGRMDPRGGSGYDFDGFWRVESIWIFLFFSLIISCS